MKASELRKKTVSELKSSRSQLRREQFKLRLVQASGELKQTHKLKEIRKDIARLEAILTEKEGKGER